MASAAALKRHTISLESRQALIGGAKAEKARRSLYHFLRQSWHVLEPGVKFEDNWHVLAFCDHVQWLLEGWLVANGKGTRAMRDRVVASWAYHGMDYVTGELLVQNMIWNLAPSTLKSRILMVIAPAWMWLHAPAWSVCAISGINDNVKRDSNAHRDLVTSAWYRGTFGITWRIRRDTDSVGDWKTTAGGERKSRTLGEGFTGVHVDALFLDDPDDADRVWSESARKGVQNRWTRAIKNRVKDMDRCLRIAIQQRVHVDDWTAAQVAKGVWSPDDRKAWAWMAIPVLFGRGPRDAPRYSPWGWCDPRTVANENMHTARFSESTLADEERDKGPEGVEAQYNQNPDRFDGGLIKRSNVRFFRIEDWPVSTRPRPAGCGRKEDGSNEDAFVLRYDKLGELDLDWMTVSVDCSNGGERVTNSAVGILVVGGKGMQRFVFDDRTEVMGIDEMYEAVAEACSAWPVQKAIIELKAAGASVISDMRKRLARGDIVAPDGRAAVIELVAYNPGNDSKESRAAAMVSSWRSGLVHVLDGADWLYPKVNDSGRTLDQGFVGEICTFPKSKRNDRVDAIAQVIAYYREAVDVRAGWEALGRM